MKLRRFRFWWGPVLSLPIFISGTCAMAQQNFPPPPPLGAPLQGLSQLELQQFNDGRNFFTRNARIADGLGPVFNGVACAECHHAGAPGGAGADLGVSRVTRIGAIVDGAYSDLTEYGGPLLQSRSLREFLPGYPVPGEVVPSQAQFVAHRITQPLFGDGLIEAIPDQTIVDLSHVPQPDGIQGEPNMVLNPETGSVEVGKFGWKAQISTLHWFASDALVNEIGITNPLFPNENLPQGHTIPPGADTVADPEDRGQGVAAATNFMRFLAPPPRGLGINVRGSQLFGTLHCASCHTPSLRTGPSSSPALANKVVQLYSDLLLHHMGPGLADHIEQGQASGDQFRTAPLWGLLRRPFWLHDGRANTVDAAIRAHGGEAAISASRYAALSARDRQNLLSFLAGL
ncbi:MAG TPA: di-heme oxidoredictase family protein [Fimbriimonadaceae bacterium]|nr:di-heme oxidoredictase family protein [Fimbriimonadaceae bacterium]